MTPDYAAACRAILDALDEGDLSRDSLQASWKKADAHRATLEAIASGAVRVVPADPPNDTSTRLVPMLEVDRDELRALATLARQKDIVWASAADRLVAAYDTASPVAPNDTSSEACKCSHGEEGMAWCPIHDDPRWEDAWERGYHFARSHPATAAHPADPPNDTSSYLHASGDVTVLGPEVFTNGNVICWRGVNYYRDTASPVAPNDTSTRLVPITREHIEALHNDQDYHPEDTEQCRVCDLIAAYDAASPVAPNDTSSEAHGTWILERDGRFRGRCLCGWDSHISTSPHIARNDAEDHLRDAASPVGPRDADHISIPRGGAINAIRAIEYADDSQPALDLLRNALAAADHKEDS